MSLGKINEDISLQGVAKVDADELFSLVDCNRIYLRQWLPWLDLNLTVSDSRAFILREQIRAEEGLGLVCGIEYRGKLCGIAGFNWIDSLNRACEVGYWLSENQQGRGIMIRCIRALITYAFTTRRLNRVTIPVAMGNKKSQAIPERLGFQREGILREAEWLYDHYVDQVMYARLQKDWKGNS